MTTLREDIVHHSPKAVYNLVLAFVFWLAHFMTQIALSPINSEQAFLLQTGLIIISGIFLVRALFNALTIADHLTKKLLKRFGITEGWSRERILKDVIYIIAVLLLAAAVYPLLDLLPNFEQIFRQSITYITLGFLFLFTFDIGRTFYRITEKKANSVANRFSDLINEEENENEKKHLYN